MSSYAEFDKLVKMLDDAGIPYEREDSVGFFTMDRVKYPSIDDCECSVIYGYGSYGYDDGTLEIMGLLTPEEEEYDQVVGYLTAEEVFERISKHYEDFVKNGE